jgi:hypothetical protein
MYCSCSKLVWKGLWRTSLKSQISRSNVTGQTFKRSLKRCAWKSTSDCFCASFRRRSTFSSYKLALDWFALALGYGPAARRGAKTYELFFLIQLS